MSSWWMLLFILIGRLQSTTPLLFLQRIPSIIPPQRPRDLGNTIRSTSSGSSTFRQNELITEQLLLATEALGAALSAVYVQEKDGELDVENKWTELCRYSADNDVGSKVLVNSYPITQGSDRAVGLLVISEYASTQFDNSRRNKILNAAIKCIYSIMKPKENTQNDTPNVNELMEIIFTTRTLVKMTLRRMQDSISQELVENTLVQLDSLSEMLESRSSYLTDTDVIASTTEDEIPVVTRSRMMDEDIWSLYKDEIVVVLKDKGDVTDDEKGTTTTNE